MAERSFQPYPMVSDPANESGLDAKNIAHIAGAILSLALLVGVGFWSYQLIVRDVSGVPVVRAAEGPIRIQPETPGGKQAQHQGLSVNAVAAEGEASAPADRLILAPAPLTLSAEDVPMQRTDGDEPEGQARASDPALDATPQAERGDAVAPDLSQAQLTAFSEPSPAQETQSQEADLASVATPAAGLARSLRPKLRPVDLVREDQAEPVRTASLDLVDPEAVMPGTGMAQLGSFESEALARSAWITLSAQFSAYLDGKQQVIQSAETGGRQFFRLRALGFEDISDARRFCSALVAEGAECIPVLSR
ncbi:MAG: SPOR domain-containing protein [Pseudomonadota bacterium]